MSTREPQKSVFEIAHGNLRAAIRYLKYELKVPSDAIKLQVDGILRSFEVEELYERKAVHPKPEGTV